MIAPFLLLIVIAVTCLALATNEIARLLFVRRIIDRQVCVWRIQFWLIKNHSGPGMAQRLLFPKADVQITKN
jgi:hypothetical protein